MYKKSLPFSALRYHKKKQNYIMMNVINSSINLYAQLPIVAEIRPIQDRLRLSDAASGITGTSCDYNLHRDEKIDHILRRLYEKVSALR